MKKFLILFCFLGLTLGCDLDYFGTGNSALRGELPDGQPPKDGGSGGGSNAGDNGGSEAESGDGTGGDNGTGGDDGTGTTDPNETLYFLTLEYPEGYDWLADTQRGHINDCYLVVYKDFNEIRRVAVSNENMVSSDPDRAYLCGDDLYTFYPLEYETVVKKNGQEFLTIRAAENIHSVLIHKGNFYTLGYGTTGRSVSLRKNGESVIFARDASIMSGLYLDGDNVGFSYVVHSKTKKYFYCVGEMAFQLQGVDSDWTVYGLKTMYSQPMYVYRDEGYIVYMVHPRLGRWDFSVAPDESYMYDYELVSLEGDVAAVEHYRYGGSEDVTIFGPKEFSISGVTASQSAVYGCDDRIVLLYAKRAEGYWLEEITSTARQKMQIPARYDYAPQKRAVVIVNGEACAGFSTKVVDGETRIQTGRNQFKELRFNGFVVALGK